MKALTAAEMREVDLLTTTRHGISNTELMENAGRAVAEFTLRKISRRFQSPIRKIAVLCGRGNNGGDGFVVARHLRQEVRNTVVILFGSPSDVRGDAALNFQRWKDDSGEHFAIENEAAWTNVLPILAAPTDVILDAMLGTGLRGAANGGIEHHPFPADRSLQSGRGEPGDARGGYGARCARVLAE